VRQWQQQQVRRVQIDVLGGDAKTGVERRMRARRVAGDWTESEAGGRGEGGRS